ncbi:MAG TPA: DUF1326 domain-containing protein [Terriglobales bacterium]|nr:DUF1326 domain-containing protein [Terriglobales bacterium]
MKNLLLAFVFLAVPFTFAQQISGDYIETRSADVYTGQCFANGEVNLVGNEAIMGWRIAKGSWDGVSLDGLNAVAVVRAKATLGDPYANPYPAKSVLVVDEAANAQQRAALVSFVHHQTGKLTENVEKVIYTTIDMAVLHDMQHHGKALLRAGDFVTVQTRGINDHDHICGNEVTFYSPLTQTAHAMPAVAEKDEYQGPGLQDTWSNSGKRSAFVGTFVVTEAANTQRRAGL